VHVPVEIPACRPRPNTVIHAVNIGLLEENFRKFSLVYFSSVAYRLIIIY